MNYYAESLRRRKKMFYLYLSFLIIWSLAIAFMPVVDLLKETMEFLLALDGILFWIGAAGTVFMAFRINTCRKNSSRFSQMYPKLKRIGLIHFFQNIEAFITDIAMFISVLGFIIANITTDNIYIPFIFLGVFVLTFGLHCMLNGINYIYINYGVRRVFEI